MILTIAPGSLITLKGEVEETGFVDVLYEGQIVKVYMSDIEKSADRVEGHAGYCRIAQRRKHLDPQIQQRWVGSGAAIAGYATGPMIDVSDPGTREREADPPRNAITIGGLIHSSEMEPT